MRGRLLALGLIGLACASAAMGATPQPKAQAPKAPACKPDRNCVVHSLVTSSGSGGVLTLQRRLLSPLLP